MSVTLRPATLEDRRTVYEWSQDRDIAPTYHMSDEPGESYERFCDDWADVYFVDEDPERGRGFIVLFKGDPVGFVAYTGGVARNRVELDIFLNTGVNCGKGFGTNALRSLCEHLALEMGVNTFMMQPSARNPRAIRAFEKAGFARIPATPEQIRAEWGGVDHYDSVLMIKVLDHSNETKK